MPAAPPAPDDPPARAPLIAAAKVSKAFGARAALRDVDLEVRRGRTVTLIGPNGAGKTTLVRILLGLLPPDGGTVRRAPRLGVGYMPQRIAVDRALPLSVGRFLRLAGADGAAASRTLERLGIAALRRRPLAEVSGGELQRVLLARALLREPDLLVLDEPAQGVDLAGQAELYGLIGEIRAERGCGVLMISHDLHLVMSSTDEVVCLNRHVCCHGRPEQVSGDPAFLSLYGPSVSGAMAVYAHRHNHEHDLGGGIRPASG